MKVKFEQSIAGRDYVYNRGDIVDVEDKEAVRLIEAGIAVKQPVKTVKKATK